MKARKAGVFLLCALIFAATTVVAQNPGVVGIYETVPLKSFTYDGKRVEVIEFLSFYCGHCYEFEKYVPVIKGNYPGKIDWKVVPIHWGKGSQKPAEAYLLAIDAGKGLKMKKALFEAKFQHKQDIGKLDILEEIAQKIGLGPDFGKKLRSGAKAKEVQDALALANEYGIDETPAMIIAGNMRVDGHALNHSMALVRDNILLMIKSIIEEKRK